MFIKGVERKSGLSDVGPSVVTVAGFVSIGSDIRAVIITAHGRFDTALLSQLRLPPRQPIGGYDGD